MVYVSSSLSLANWMAVVLLFVNCFQHPKGCADSSRASLVSSRAASSAVHVGVVVAGSHCSEREMAV